MDYNRAIKRLKEHDGVRIDEKEIRSMLAMTDYIAYHKLLTKLVGDSILEPVKSSGPNGMTPPLYKRYRIIKEEPNYTDKIHKIRKLHSVFNIEGYLNQLAKYVEHEVWLDVLDRFIKQSSDVLNMPMSINERSFQIFSREKALKDDKSLISVLNFNPGLREMLNYYMTPEPFFAHNITSINVNDNSKLNILIIENKDTWYTLRKVMNPDNNNLFGVQFHVFIYGEGKKITRITNSLTDYNKLTYSNNNNRCTYYYFGDLDYEGIGIYEDLKSRNSGLDIKLMVPLYIMMLSKSDGEDIDLPETKENQVRRGLGAFLSSFEPSLHYKITNILNSNRYIPQEILNCGDFIKFIQMENKNV